MASANSNVQMVDLDFVNIKNNLKTFLQSQDVLSDYNYEGSALSVLIDLLAYNTQYNAYYLNMVSNEMFLDTALQRSSVISHAKLLNYTPKSRVAPTATINLSFSSVNTSSLTLPKFTSFMSEALEGVNYNFVSANEVTVNTINGVAQFPKLQLKQGIPSSLVYQVQSVTNPTYTFQIPEIGVDTSTISVSVQNSYSNTTTEVFSLAQDYLTLDDKSSVYFLQESLTDTYEIYFGDGVLGKKLADGNIIRISYIVTQGTTAAGANNFVLMDSINGNSIYVIEPVQGATQGAEKESLSSIKFQAPKNYAAQNRAVTKNDYITLIQQNKFNVPIESVSVWGGEDNDPPEFGSVYAAIKPTGAYNLTDYQKQVLINDVLKPVSIMTVVPKIVDVDYLYLLVNADILYDTKKTTLTSSQVQNLIRQGIIYYANQNLNTFNSTFSASGLIQFIQNIDSSIVAVDFDLKMQKRLLPRLNNQLDYKIEFGNAIDTQADLNILPSYAMYDSSGNLISNVFFEESTVHPGTLRTYYYNNNVKYIATESTDTNNAGSIDYKTGTVILKDLNPNSINSNDGLLRINATPDVRIISSTYQRIITLDEQDPLSVMINLRTN